MPPNGVYNDTTVSIMMGNNNNGNVLQQRAASLPHHFVIPPESDFDIYADLPKPTPNLVSFRTRYFKFSSTFADAYFIDRKRSIIIKAAVFRVKSQALRIKSSIMSNLIYFKY